jgi:hypothetical protein
MANLEDLGQAVRDVDDSDSARRQATDRREQCSRLALAERRRRLVHDEDAGIERQSPRNLDHLPLGEAQRGHDNACIERRANLAKNFLRSQALTAAVDQPRPSTRLTPEKDVLGGRECRHEGQLLIDHADAELARMARAGDLDTSTIDPDLSGVLVVRATEDLHQRALPGPVLTE